MKWPEGDAMDNLFDKMGLYDFFGILIPGMFFLGAMIVIDLPILDVFYVSDSGTVFVILFVVRHLTQNPTPTGTQILT